MQIVIDIDERRFKDILRISTVQLRGRTPTLEQVIATGTPLPKGVTNGDVIMSMFPTVDTYFSNVIDMKLWWNAKYKGTGEIHCNHTDAEIAKSFIEDVEAVKGLLPRAESED